MCNAIPSTPSACSTRSSVKNSCASPPMKRVTPSGWRKRSRSLAVKSRACRYRRQRRKIAGSICLRDVEEAKHGSKDLSEQIQTVRDKLPDIAAMLERIYQDSEKHRNEIRGMLMRSDPQSSRPA